MAYEKAIDAGLNFQGWQRWYGCMVRLGPDQYS